MDAKTERELLYSPEELKQAKKAAKAAKIREAQDALVLQNIMATDLGRRWMHDLLAQCQVFGSTFTGEALTSAFKEGQRTVGLMVFMGVMTACPDAYIMMMREVNGGRSDDADDSDDTGDEDNA